MNEHQSELWRVQGKQIMCGAIHIGRLWGDNNRHRAVKCRNGCIGFEDPETTVPKLVAVAHKVEAWLLRLAKAADERAKNTTFETLVEANQADAKNYRAVARDLHTELAKTGKQHDPQEPQ